MKKLLTYLTEQNNAVKNHLEWWTIKWTAGQKMKFSIKDFFSKYDHIRRNYGFGHIYRRNP